MNTETTDIRSDIAHILLAKGHAADAKEAATLAGIAATAISTYQSEVNCRRESHSDG